YAKHDSSSLEKASRILEELSSGIDKSIEKYQGTQVYEKALLDLQSKDDFKGTYSDSESVRDQTPKQETTLQKSSDKVFNDIVTFQKESVKANQEDLDNQKKLQEALRSNQPGFIPKI